MNNSAMLKRQRYRMAMQRFWIVYLLLIPCVLFLIIFRYYPIILQTVLSFKNFRLADGIWGSKWVGFDNFITILTSPDMARVIWNTIKISLLRLLFGFVPPIILAIMLVDVTSRKRKRISQTIVYIPHFFSWTVVYAVSYALFSNSGIINAATKLLGLGSYDYLMSQKAYLPLLLCSAIWKEIGWNTIIYLAALMSINTELFEVAKVDGAGPLKRIWYVTLPGISSVIVFLLILSLGNILRGAGTEQILLFYSPPVYNISDIMDTWVYREGLSKIQYSLGSAITFFQSVFGLALVLICNKISSKYANVGIW